MHRVRVLVAALIAVFAVAASTAAAGGPSPGVSWGSSGVAGDQVRYVALRAGLGTLVEKISVQDGRVLASRFVLGRYGVPVVTFDGTTSGLSHDGNTLVVATLPGLPDTGLLTHFAVLDTKTLRVRKLIALKGTFSFDAIAPDGKTVYLIEFTSQQNYNRYRVRALDPASGKLLPGAIVDKREPNERMNGQPMRRVESPDGAWVYTLYSRTEEAPFIHALDAAHRAAFCIDLDWHGSQAAAARLRLTLSADGSQLVLSQPDGKRVLAVKTPG